jgi:hypothetical protein
VLLMLELAEINPAVSTITATRAWRPSLASR